MKIFFCLLFLAFSVMSQPTPFPGGGGGAVTQSGTWSVRTQDGSGNALESSTSAPVGTEQALITRNIPNGTQTVAASVAHGSAGTSVNPMLEGCVAISHGANPTAVAANQLSRCYANRAGVPWMIGGHPNVVTTQYYWTSAQTDDAVVTVSSGLKIVVTRASVTCSRGNSVNVAVRLGFGTANLPTAPTDGNSVDGILMNHDGVAPGSGVVEGVGSGILGIGADGEDLRITTSVSTGGSCSALISYYTIES